MRFADFRFRILFTATFLKPLHTVRNAVPARVKMMNRIESYIANLPQR
jgi:hypothetical protein